MSLARPQRAPDPDHGAWLVFRLGPHRLCAAARTVEGIIEPPRLTRLPGMPAGVIGVFAFREEFALAVSLPRKLGVRPGADPASGSYIVARVAQKYAGFQVDEAQEVLEPAGASWHALPPMLGDELFDGFAVREGELILRTTFEALLHAKGGSDLKATRAQLEAIAPKPKPAPTPALTPAPAPQMPVATRTESKAAPSSLAAKATPRPAPKPASAPVKGVAKARVALVRPPRPAAPERVERPAPPPAPEPVEAIESAAPHEPEAAERPRAPRVPPASLVAERTAPMAPQPVAKLPAPTPPPAPRVEPVSVAPTVAAARERESNAGVFIALAIATAVLLALGYWLWPEPPPGPKPAVVSTMPAEPAPDPRTQIAAAPVPAPVPSPAPAPVQVLVDSPRLSVTVERAPAPPAAKPAPEPNSFTHVVVRGDTLWAIARRYLGNPHRYPELAKLSGIRDPNLIHPGDLVRIRRK